jgi:hypothetical protein
MATLVEPSQHALEVKNDREGWNDDQRCNQSPEPGVKSLISRFNVPKADSLASPRGPGKSREGAGAEDVSSNTAKDHTENADAFAASKQPRVGDLKQLQERCSQLEARLSRQNNAVLEFENELQIYEVGVHQALLILGIEEGLRGLTSASAAEQLQLSIRTLLNSESYLLNRTEEMNEEILLHKDLEAAVLRTVNNNVTKETVEQDSAQPATKVSSATEAAAAAQNEQYIQELKLRSEQQDEELRELYAYSTQLLEKICEVQEDNARLRAQQDQAPVPGQVTWDTEKRALLTVIAAHETHAHSPSSAHSGPDGNRTNSASSSSAGGMTRDEREQLYASLRALLGVEEQR